MLSRQHAQGSRRYILASKRNGTLYIGVTSDLFGRVVIHKQDLIEGFTKRYGVHQVAYYEMHLTMDAAILREKRLKKWNRGGRVEEIRLAIEGRDESLKAPGVDLFDWLWGASTRFWQRSRSFARAGRRISPGKASGGLSNEFDLRRARIALH